MKAPIRVGARFVGHLGLRYRIEAVRGERVKVRRLRSRVGYWYDLRDIERVVERER